MSSDRNRTPRSNRDSRTNRPSGSSSGGGSSRKPSGSTSNAPSGGASSPAPISAMGRKRAEERMKEREQQKRRQQIITVVVIVGVLVGVALLAVVLRNAPADAPIVQTAARYDGLPADRNDDGYPRLGNPNTPIEVALYSSFDCESCGTFHDNIIQGLVDRVRGGGIKLVYVPMAGTGTFTNGRGAAVSALCVAEQDPSAYWQIVDTFYAWKTQFGSQAYTDPRMRSAAEQVGADVGAWYGCVNSSRPGDILTLTTTQSRALANFATTPAVTINGIVPLDTENVPLIDPQAILTRIDEEVARIQRPGSGDVEATPEADSTAEATVEPTAEATP